MKKHATAAVSRPIMHECWDGWNGWFCWDAARAWMLPLTPSWHRPPRVAFGPPVSKPVPTVPVVPPVASTQEKGAHSAEYTKRVNSEAWRVFRQEIGEERGWCCERCGDEGRLELHHLHYRTLGNERPEDVELLCPSCHLDADLERKENAAHDAWLRRVDAWAKKRFGDTWQRSYLQEDVIAAFQRYLKRRGETPPY